MSKLLTWRKSTNDMGQLVREAHTPDGVFVIDGNGYGRARWSVTYPDGDYGVVDSMSEAIAWAEQWAASAAAVAVPSRDALEAGAWRDFARYSGAATLTYLEDAPEGRGPWFVAHGVADVFETADYAEALAAYAKATA